MRSKIFLLLIATTALLGSCGNKTKSGYTDADTIVLRSCPQFEADSAMSHIVAQCAFGPRVTGSTASLQCAQWIKNKFDQYGCTTEFQDETVKTWDGTHTPCRNIIARINPQAHDRILICTHWDSRPWADNDPDPNNHHTPVPAANDGASGVAVMLEMARIIQSSPIADTFGIDFVCFDAEDMGTPEWAEQTDSDDTSGSTWCLGSEAWAQRARMSGYEARYGILLDMVGGRGATFAREQVSQQYAAPVLNIVWALASQLGYSSYFVSREGGALMDDHVNVNAIAAIPCIDIVPHYQHGPSSFGPTWHTIADTPDNIDTATLNAVGHTLIQLMYNESGLVV